MPSQRRPEQSEVRDVLVGVEDSDESLDRVVAAAREAEAAGVGLRLRASADEPAHGEAIARERVAQRLELAAQMARALCPGLEVTVADQGGAEEHGGDEGDAGGGRG